MCGKPKPFMHDYSKGESRFIPILYDVVDLLFALQYKIPNYSNAHK